MLYASKDHQQQADLRVLCDHLFARNDGEAREGVQLIDGAVSFDANRVFSDALAACETRLSGIATFCIDAIERDARVVEGLVVHALYVSAAKRPLPDGQGSVWHAVADLGATEP